MRCVALQTLPVKSRGLCAPVGDLPVNYRQTKTLPVKSREMCTGRHTLPVKSAMSGAQCTRRTLREIQNVPGAHVPNTLLIKTIAFLSLRSFLATPRQFFILLLETGY